MWIVLNNAYLSIVEFDGEPENLLVRARIAGDIEAAFPFRAFDEGEIEFDAGTDYAFRVKVPRSVVSKVIANAVLGIDYTNFKNSVPDRERAMYYGDIWNTMFEFQQRRNPI